MKEYNLKIDKQFIYIFIIVLAIVFTLFFLTSYFDISTSTFTVKTNSEDFGNKITGGVQDVDDLNENFEKYFNK